MQLRLDITRQEGLRNDLLLRLDLAEIDAAFLSIAHRDQLMALPGIPRHRPATAEEAAAFLEAKTPIEDHLARLGLVDASGSAARRAIAVSNRNVGSNIGQIAWQRTERPRVFRIAGDPADWPAYSCLTSRVDGSIAIEELRIDAATDAVSTLDGRDLGAELDWATAGPRILRAGRVARIEDIAHEFYDIRHVFAFDPRSEEGEAIRAALYDGFPRSFRTNVERAWRQGVPRSRYFHHAVGLSREALVILQREGTIEEIGAALRDAGADDGLILDNGGSVACWVWWANDHRGGLVSPTVDYRPPASSVIAFLLKGPLRPIVPGGSVSYTTL